MNGSRQAPHRIGASARVEWATRMRRPHAHEQASRFEDRPVEALVRSA